MRAVCTRFFASGVVAPAVCSLSRITGDRVDDEVEDTGDGDWEIACWRWRFLRFSTGETTWMLGFRYVMVMFVGVIIAVVNCGGNCTC